LPFVASKVESELSDLRKDLSAKVAPKTFPDGITLTTVRTLPEQGRNKQWLENEWKNLKMLERGDVDSGRVSGTVYHVSQLKRASDPELTGRAERN
jgi:sphinganine-1-phosphate aldolase